MQQDMIGQNIIITEPSSSLRTLGRNALKDKWKLAITAFIVYDLCLFVPQAILNALFGVSPSDIGNQDYGYMYVYNDDMYNSVPHDAFLSDVYSLLVTGAFTLGISLFFLAMFRKHIVEVGDIFLGFERFGKALGLYLFRALFTILWTCLFIVPGIIAAIRYSQAFFVLADDPSKSIRECMNESKRMMKGNKAKYFCLSLSFIGWALLAGMVAGVIAALTYIDMPTIIEELILVVGTLAVAPVSVYIYSTFAGFYEILAGHLIKETEPRPVAPDAVPMAFEEEKIPEEKIPEEKIPEEKTSSAAGEDIPKEYIPKDDDDDPMIPKQID